MPVVTTTVQQKAMPVTLPAVGNVEAITSVQIRAQVTGQLSAIHFTEGQEVRKGQPLFSLDARPFQAALQQAQAVLARDTATFENAKATQARGENLFQRGLIPRDQYESQKASAAALGATVEADKAAIENAKLNLQFAEIAAPLTGRTGALNAHVGDLVRANDTTPLVVINQTAPVYVTFSVPGRYLADIRHFQSQKPLAVLAASPGSSLTGQPEQQGPSAVQTASTQASPPGQGPVGTPGSTPPLPAPGAPAPTPLGPAARGTVTFIDNAVDPTTGTIRLKATFPNDTRDLWPGAFVQVTLQLTTDPDAIVVPATAVQTSQDGQFVYVVKAADRTVEMRPVTTERQLGDQMIIAKGLSAGETVVTDGQLRLVPGARVSERGDTGGADPRGAGAGRGAGEAGRGTGAGRATGQAGRGER